MINETDLHWLAGLLEGEGSFLAGEPSNPNAPRISIAMTDDDVIKRAAGLIGIKSIYTRHGKGNWRTSYQFHLKGTRAVNLMQQLRPLMGTRRQKQIDRALASYNPHFRSLAQSELTQDQVLEIYRRAWQSESLRRISQEMGVSYNACSDIKRGHSWAWLTQHPTPQRSSKTKTTRDKQKRQPRE